MARINQLKHWTEVPVMGDAVILVRPIGDQYVTKLNRLRTDYATANGIKQEDIPREVVEDMGLRASIGETFGGWRNFEDENGNPIPGGSDPDNLDVDNSLKLLAVDEVGDAWVTARNRLSREKAARWNGVQGNS